MNDASEKLLFTAIKEEIKKEIRVCVQDNMVSLDFDIDDAVNNIIYFMMELGALIMSDLEVDYHLIQKKALDRYIYEDIKDDTKAATTEDEKYKIIYALGYTAGYNDLFFCMTEQNPFSVLHDNKAALDELRKIQEKHHGNPS